MKKILSIKELVPTPATLPDGKYVGRHARNEI